MASDLDTRSRERNTTATELAFDRLRSTIDAGAEGKLKYPRDAILVPADLPDFGDALKRAIRAERPVVVIYADGTEKMIIPGPASRTRVYWLRLFREHLKWRAEQTRQV